MSKKLIQTKLSFSSSQPEPVNDEVTKPFLKRKLSDSAVEEDMSEPGKSRHILSYADAVDVSSAQSNKYVKKSDCKDNDSYDKQDKISLNNEAGRSTRTEHSTVPDASDVKTTRYGLSTVSDASDVKPTRYVHSTVPDASDVKTTRFHANIESSSGSIQENAGASSNLQRSTLIDSQPDEDDLLLDSSDYMDDTHNYNRIEKDKPNTSHDSDPCWKGVPLSELKKAPECFKSRYKKLSPGPGHIVFFDVLNGEMYYSWDKICVALSKYIPGTLELQRTILSYNPHYRRKWSFEGLHLYFEQNKESSKMKDEFFVTILPKMQNLALRLPELCPMAIPILKQRRNMKITFSQEQIACLLANAFFCTFPKRNFKPKNSPLPDINFSNLYSESQCSRKFEKFKCIINYFKRVTTTMPTGAVTYARQYEISDNTFWNTTDKKFTNLHVSTSGTIEDDGRGMLQADFANKYVGGGVLGHGLVQEEIRFLICPEMILSRLFTEVLTDNEVLIMTGCERFSNYEGYSESFKFSGDHQDTTESDVWKRKCTEVVAMDALVVRGDKTSQFDKEKVVRELNKAYCAFKGNEFSDDLPAVCTGNWGCGAFGGDKELKALIQMMAASAANRDICYFTFGDSSLCNKLGDVHAILMENYLSISNVFELIRSFKNNLYKSKSVKSLFQYIVDTMGDRENPQTNQEEKNSKSLIANTSSSDSEMVDNDENYKINTP